jgi:hypothetical protein
MITEELVKELKAEEELFARVHERAKAERVDEARVMPVYLYFWPESDAQLFMTRVMDLGLEMGVKIRPIKTDNDLDKQTLMRLIGGTDYVGTVEA